MSRNTTSNQPTETLELAAVTKEPLPVAAPAPAPIEMMQAMIKNGMKEGDVAAFEKLAELQWRFEARDAEKAFASAFQKLQGDCKNVKAVHIVPTRDGKTKYKVAKFEEIWEMLKPLFERYEFTASFTQSYEQSVPLRVTQNFILQHVPSGHKITSPFTVRVGQTDAGMQDYQSDGKATTYAKTRAVCNCLNIVIEQAVDENDPRNLGDTNTKITPEQAGELEHQVKMLNRNVAAFLKLAGAATFGEIPAANFPMLERMLKSAKPL